MRIGPIRSLPADSSLLVRYISLSDYILVLGPGGTVVEQGVYSELVHSGGYLASLTPKEGRTERVHRQSDNQDPALTNTALRNANLNADNLPASDLAIYKFYVDQTGRVSFCVFFVLCSGFVVGLLFSRKWSYNLFLSPFLYSYSLRDKCLQKSGSSSGWKPTLGEPTID